LFRQDFFYVNGLRRPNIIWMSFFPGDEAGRAST
jgi:hypothetical protein